MYVQYDIFSFFGVLYHCILYSTGHTYTVACTYKKNHTCINYRFIVHIELAFIAKTV
jgi:hypothetical protein